MEDIDMVYKKLIGKRFSNSGKMFFNEFKKLCAKTIASRDKIVHDDIDIDNTALNTDTLVLYLRMKAGEITKPKRKRHAESLFEQAKLVADDVVSVLVYDVITLHHGFDIVHDMSEDALKKAMVTTYHADDGEQQAKWDARIEALDAIQQDWDELVSLSDIEWIKDTTAYQLPELDVEWLSLRLAKLIIFASYISPLSCQNESRHTLLAIQLIVNNYNMFRIVHVVPLSMGFVLVDLFHLVFGGLNDFS